ncbi:MAG TPA: glycoside hydrolase family 3 N-terminal domain-containing protein, partial [Anaerolineales bacterium]|nr:glycoside hydrolase family 3 N-terminal domain-containing protein [Anaerolineales bacterium]
MISRAQRGGNNICRRVFHIIALSVLILSLAGSPPPAHAQTEVPPQQVRQLFQKMTPEERVGQLFLVTFNGTDTSAQSQIYDLITNHHIGGVILLGSNNNFLAAPSTVSGVYQLTQSLQEIEWSNTANPPSGNQPAYIPLFIGISQDGDGSPGDQILSGLTPLPSEMAIGASWSPDLANKVGAAMGRELSALGINMYFGPSLDVVESPIPSAGSDLGSSVFGGDPYWVSV